MDIDEETGRLKTLLFVGVIFLFSIYMSWREFNYTIFGDSVNARLVRVYQSKADARFLLGAQFRPTLFSAFHNYRVSRSD